MFQRPIMWLQAYKRGFSSGNPPGEQVLKNIQNRSRTISLPLLSKKTNITKNLTEHNESKTIGKLKKMINNKTNLKMKLKYLIVLMAMSISIAALAQKEQNLKAFYTGFDKEYEIYSFEDADGITVEFANVKSDVLKQFDLLSTKFIDKAFIITYTVKEAGDDEDSYDEYTIISLKSTVLKRNEQPEEDFEEE